MASSASTTNLRALQGLRGIASLHVVFAHINQLFCKVDLMASGTMNIFYMLSGFTLMLGYCQRSSSASINNAQRPLPPSSFLKDRVNALYGNHSRRNDVPVSFDAHGFLIRRLQKILPMYYAGVVMGSIAVYIFYPQFLAMKSPLEWVLTALAVTSWWLPPLYPVGNLILWSVSINLFFYLAFPALAPWIQKLAKEKGVTGIRRLVSQLYVAQAVWMLVWMVPCFYYWSFTYYSVSRMVPLARLPVFLMGCCAAKEYIGCGNDDSDTKEQRKESVAEPKPSATREASKMVVAIAIGIVAGMSGLDARPIIFMFDADNLVARWILEALIPITVYNLLLSVTDEDSQSTKVVRILNSGVAQFLGKISFSLYVSHVPVYMTIFQVLKGVGVNDLSLLRWSALPTLLVCVAVGWAFFCLYEMPLSALFRRTSATRKTIKKD